MDEILASGQNRFSKFNDDLVNTGGNLNYEALDNICTICGVDPLLFHEHKLFIDVVLLKRRNGIAHGEDTFVQANELDDLTDRTVQLMRLFSNELQAKAYLQAYRLS